MDCRELGAMGDIGRMTTKPALRLSKLIADETSGAITLNRLADLINDANKHAGTGCSLNRKTLAKIRDEPQKVGLTWNILVALNTYFRKRGLGLQQLPILETRGVMEVLLDSAGVVFMLGAKPRPEERRTDISRWDTRSLAELLTLASRLDVHHEFDIEDVLWCSPVNPAAIKTERWHRILDEDQASVISIGSPLAALSSEVMLARMFGVAPFTPPQVKTSKQVPFFFVWLPRLARNFRSAFGLTWRELESDAKAFALRVKNNQSSAFVLDGVTHGVSAEGKSWTMYGVIAAQRRAAGNVWLVVSGLAGPATNAATKMVKEITAELPWGNGKPSSVLWIPVKVKIKVGEAGSVNGDCREIVQTEFDGEPRFWP